ncbi:MAG: ELM1/GtrOC1 family putative glycosyltransferase, partial [Candidatus Omnitrophica bacterium]|nr:ELM1/GtrOC1 family putative glycosyltransferase [Candidatus Omnitrophota bacterium]
LGAKIFHKNAGVRQLIEVLKNNQAIGMTIDQGGKAGQIVKFFGKEASMATGAVKLALKYDCAIVPVFYTRLRGPHTKVILDQVYTVSRSADPENDVRENLQKLINIYEKYLRQYPQEYFWSYKIWKYGREKDILILSDSRTGHLRQSEAVARLIDEKYKINGFKANIFIKEVKFRSEITRFIFYLGKTIGFLRYALTKGSWEEILSLKPDVVISAGSSVSAVNYLLSSQNGAKSICLMKPGAGSLAKFDLAIIPQHDRPEGRGLASFCQSRRPASKKNVVVTEGALNLIGPDYLKEKSERLVQSGLLKGKLLKPCIGLLIGGPAKGFSIKPDIIEALCREIKKSALGLNASILISTSRRTPLEIEARIKTEFAGYPNCNLLVIANENNNPDVAGGIFGLSDIIISSPDSISMISEAVSAKKYVVVFKNDFLSPKHKLFLKLYQEKKYIYLKQIDELSQTLNDIWQNKPKVNFTDDNSKVAEALSKIL